MRLLFICSIFVWLIISPIEGQLVYKEISPPEIIKSGGFEIDFNEDSIVDLLIWKDSYKVGAGCISVQSGDILSVMPNDTAYLYYDSTGVLYTFNYLDTIKESINCIESLYICPDNSIYRCPFLIHHQVHWFDCSSSSSTFTGLYREVRNKYIGFRLKILGHYHYGWINFSKNEGVDFKLRAFAYNTFPEEAIEIDDPFFTSQETTRIASMKLYPNPVKNVLTIEDIGGEGTIEILDLSGRITFSQKYYYSPISIPVNSLVNGVYILLVSTANGRTIEKFIKE